MFEANKEVYIYYKNHRGERGVRHIQPVEMWFGETEHHKGPQWLLRAYDLDKKDMRNFALQDVYMWSPSLSGMAGDSKIKVNAKDITWHKPTITHEELAVMGVDSAFEYATVTYFAKLPNGGHVQGILHHQSPPLEIIDGMIFNVCHTGNA